MHRAGPAGHRAFSVNPKRPAHRRIAIARRGRDVNGEDLVSSAPAYVAPPGLFSGRACRRGSISGRAGFFRVTARRDGLAGPARATGYEAKRR
jgi:hypothetical protein